MTAIVEVNGRARKVSVERAGHQWRVAVDGRQWVVDAVRVNGHTLSLLIGDVPALSREVTVTPSGPGQWSVRVGGSVVSTALNGARERRHADGETAEAGPRRIVAPMPGRVVRVLAAAGDRVRARQPLVVVEAMKMENELRAPGDGVLVSVSAQAGQSVEAGALLAIIDVTPA